ncbi:MAG: zf-TFIIB domain-containing protein [Reyranella sp.]|nr:zf-TFIIB domain-containing protein [Reyranella sp.]
MSNAADSNGQGLLCPTCRVDLVMSERQGIEIDYCPKCRGVWLDRGELDKIIERSAKEEAPAAPPQQQQPSQSYADQGRYEDGNRSAHGGGHGGRGSRGGHGGGGSFLRRLFD